MDQSTAGSHRGGALRYMTADDWILHREQITRVYRDENKTLRQTMDIVEAEHGLKATVKMWKTKITEWGLDKNNKKDDVLAMLRKKAERDAAGKKTVFKLRGRDVDFKDIQRYATRNHISETTIGELVASHPQTPPDLQCLTPEPAPGMITGRRAGHMQELRFRRVKTSTVGGYQRSTMRGPSVDGFHVTAPPFQTRSSYESFELEAAPDDLQPAVYSEGRFLPNNREADALSCPCSVCSVEKLWYERPRFVASSFSLGTLTLLMKKEMLLPFPVVLRPG